LASSKEILKETAHRPYPIPPGPWVLRQSWDNLLFAHWKVPFNKVRAVVPAELELDTYEGSCYVGVVPFAMANVRPRYFPSVPLLSNFLELNLRTYVKTPRTAEADLAAAAVSNDSAGRAGQQGGGGVYFFSLDCSNAVAVELGCKVYQLPYYNALMKLATDGGWHHYQCVRLHAGEEQLKFKASYREIGPVIYSQPGSLEAFLTERYCFLLSHQGTICRGDVHHKPWPLQAAEAKIDMNTMASKFSFDLSSEEPILHYSKHLDTVEWPLTTYYRK
jgi:uncharacterized protein YqjF (DUF2071 family)